MSAFDDALDELRFGDAADHLDPGDDHRRAELEARRAGARERALALHDRILELGHHHRYREILELAGDERTGRLLELLPDTQRFRAELQLTQAERWAESQRTTARRRLAEAGRALDRLDVELARGLLARVDGRYLDGGLAEERDALLLAVSARSMEVEELTDAARRAVDEIRPPRPRRRWWRRGD